MLADAVLAWRAERRLERERQVAARRHRRLLALAVAAIVALAAVTAIAVFALVERNQRPHARAAGDRARARGERAARPAGGRGRQPRARAPAARLEQDARSEAVLRQVLLRVAPAPVASGARRRSRPSSSAPAGAGSSSPAAARASLLYDLAGGRARTFRDPATVTAAALGPGKLLLSGDT